MGILTVLPLLGVSRPYAVPVGEADNIFSHLFLCLDSCSHQFLSDLSFGVAPKFVFHQVINKLW